MPEKGLKTLKIPATDLNPLNKPLVLGKKQSVARRGNHLFWKNRHTLLPTLKTGRLKLRFEQSRRTAGKSF